MADKVYCEDCRSLLCVSAEPKPQDGHHICNHENNLSQSDSWLRRKPVSGNTRKLFPWEKNAYNDCPDFGGK